MALSLQDLLDQTEFWVFLFASGWMLLNWPLIKLAEGLVVMGMPALLVYVASVWLFFVLALYLFDRGNFD